MGHRIQGIFSIDIFFKINRELTMALMRLFVIKYLNRLTALIYSYSLILETECIRVQWIYDFGVK